ncbi:MAG: hypothetical protein H6737_04240 [Alphaproteobacteria bacterium]|nr:hypothetical protein [Alphaproteobacteria bacterium]
MLAWLAIAAVHAAPPEAPGPAPATEAAPTEPEWGVPVRFAPTKPALDTSRGLPLPRNTRLNPTARNAGLVVGIGAAVLATFAGSAALGVLSRDPLPRDPVSLPGAQF